MLLRDRGEGSEDTARPLAPDPAGSAQRPGKLLFLQSGVTVRPQRQRKEKRSDEEQKWLTSTELIAQLL